MKKFLLASVALAAFSASAMAADLPVRSAAAGPAYAAPAFSWNGFYAGVNGGYVQSTSKWTDVDNFEGNDLIHPKSRASSGTFGVQAGYNVQFAPNWVGGLETDINYANARNSKLYTLYCDEGCDSYDYKSQLTYFGTVRARLGYATDRTLVYVTGGYAYGQFKHSMIDDGYELIWNQSKVKSGWALGGGVEHAIASNWTVKAEALYMDFGSKGTMAAIYPEEQYSCGDYSSVACRAKAKDTAFVARLGLNYKFGGPAPVVAKY